jgi:transposase
MLTRMSEQDWTIALEVFAAVRSRRGDKGRDDLKFLQALHYFAAHNVTWRALPKEFGNWNTIWKRFWRLSQSGVFEAFFDALASLSQGAHLVQMLDSAVTRPHVFAAGTKGCSTIRLSNTRVEGSRRRSVSRPILMDCRSRSI